MDLWDEDLCLMQCGPPRKVWKWKHNTVILVAIDFEKAYESFAHDFLFKIRKKINFGPYLKQWIRTFYTDIYTLYWVLNKALKTEAHSPLCKLYIYIYIYIWITVSIQIIFCTERRVRQSDPLAPLFFILGLKILACEIRQDNNIEGMRIYLHSLMIRPDFQICVCYYARLEAYLRFSGKQCEKKSLKQRWKDSYL